MFTACEASDWNDVAGEFASAPDDPLYLRIADSRQNGEIPEAMTESELMRRFQVSRNTLRAVLSRISEEGWVVQRTGKGWHFQSMIDSPEAYDESFAFRHAIEPAGLLSATFCYDPAELADLRREQQRIVDGGFRTMTPIELFESNSRFHETMAGWSGNRFIAQSVRRVNRLRRLVEYRQAAQRPERRVQATEHLEILAAIERYDMIDAASRIRQHLEGARRKKAHGTKVFPGPAATARPDTPGRRR